MKSLSDRFNQLCLILLALATIALVVGIPAFWVGILCFAVLDVASIAWATERDRTKKSGLREPSRPERKKATAFVTAYR